VELNLNLSTTQEQWDFPGGASDKEPTCQHRRCRRILYQVSQQREGTSLQSLLLILSLPDSYNGLKGTVGDGRAEVKAQVTDR